MESFSEASHWRKKDHGFISNENDKMCKSLYTLGKRLTDVNQHRQKAPFLRANFNCTHTAQG